MRAKHRPPNQPAGKDIPHDHDGLAHDLAMWLSSPYGKQCVTWENIEFPIEATRPFGCRPDVFAMKSTLTAKNWNPTTFEVKISVADFQSDIRTGKWRKYLAFSAYVFFAIPAKLLAHRFEIPKECGLAIRHGDGWEIFSRGKRNKDWKLTERQWMNLCIKARNPTPFEIQKEIDAEKGKNQ